MSRDMTARVDTRIEWWRVAPGQWHRVRVASGVALCRRPIGRETGKPGFERRGDSYRPPTSMRCQGCNRMWPIFRWAVARLQREESDGD